MSELNSIPSTADGASPVYSTSSRTAIHPRLPLINTDPEKAGSSSARSSTLGMLGAFGGYACANVRTSRRRFGSVLAVLGLVCTGVIWINAFPSGWEYSSISRTTSTTVPSESSDKVISQEGPLTAESSTSSLPVQQHSPPKRPPLTELQKWGLDFSSEHLLSGLSPWPANPPVEENVQPLSSLGHFADSLYQLGPITLPEYHAQLVEFVHVAFPRTLRKDLEKALEDYTRDESSRQAWDVQKIIWQTDKDESRKDDRMVRSWSAGQAQYEGWQYEMVTDLKADKYVKKILGGSRMSDLWDQLPQGILKADMIRYLMLYLKGGIYSDTDTTLLKDPARWGRGARLWRDGAGWLDSASLDRLEAGEEVDKVLPPPSIVVGIEADVGGREDWYDWWPRPMQIVQWTMASVPFHPITLSALLRILHATGTAINWAHAHHKEIQQLDDLGEYEKATELLKVDILTVPKHGGPVGVMDWTGPGVWTDAVLSHLRVKYGLLWTDLRGIREPLRVGDVVILPVTGFSPGVGNFGSESVWDAQAMVEHSFRGSWKLEERTHGM